MSHSNHFSAQQQQSIAKQIKKIDTNHFFNLLTSLQLLDLVEGQLPEHRERQFPPTVALAMFLGQVMSADGSCQNAVTEVNVNRLLSGLPMFGASTGGYCLARQRLPLEMIKILAQQIGALLNAHTPFD